MYKNLTELKRELPPHNGCPQQSIDWKNLRAATNPSQFGPAFWFTLHNSSLNYPMQPSRIAQKTMKSFIEALPMLLPCKNCSKHALEFLARSSIDQAVQNRQSLFYFFWRFHNHVNERLGKPHLPFLTTIRMYNQS
jgi:FAD-linked sulfhydryl oxidase